jgi:hypothetical protein
MAFLITILAAILTPFGISLLFSPARGAFFAGAICIGSGVYAYDEKSLNALAVGFGLLWVMRLLGFEQRWGIDEMFGLFKKSGFDAEMDQLDKQGKAIGSELMVAMSSFQISKQAELISKMACNCEDKVACCKKYGEFAEAQKWEDAKNKALRLRG